MASNLAVSVALLLFVKGLEALVQCFNSVDEDGGVVVEGGGSRVLVGPPAVENGGEGAGAGERHPPMLLQPRVRITTRPS